MTANLIGRHHAIEPLVAAIPDHWGTVRFKGAMERIEDRNADLSRQMMSLRSTGEVVERSSLGQRQEPDAASLPRYLIAKKGDLVVNPMWLVGGAIGVSTVEGAVSPDYRVFRTRGVHLPRYLHYLARSKPYIDQYLLYTRAQTTFDRRVQQSDLDNLPLPVPPIEEQRVISDLLDRETAQIDTLIEAQLRLIELLRERRVSVVTAAITKGSDPRARLIETGEPSLGAVPSHWSLVRIKNVGRAIIGLTYGPSDVVGPEDGGILVLRAGNIQDGQLSFTDNVFVSCEVPADLRLRPGDIVICARNGSARLIGKNAVVTPEVEGQTWGAFMAVLRSELNPYLRWVLNSQIFSAQTGLFSTSTINQLTSSTLHNLRFALPPPAEQRRIIANLDEQTAKIDALIADSHRFIELVKERRAALITAAVTGQIDARVEVV